MIYLEKKDLIAVAYERLIDECSTDEPDILDKTEKKGIDIIKTTIGTRYNVVLIFDEINPIINQVIVDILAKWVVYRLVKRNAARKVPTDYKDDYDEAMALLKDISTGKMILSDMPGPVDPFGNPSNSNAIFGNNTNKDYYI